MAAQTQASGHSTRLPGRIVMVFCFFLLILRCTRTGCSATSGANGGRRWALVGGAFVRNAVVILQAEKTQKIPPQDRPPSSSIVITVCTARSIIILVLLEHIRGHHSSCIRVP